MENELRLDKNLILMTAGGESEDEGSDSAPSEDNLSEKEQAIIEIDEPTIKNELPRPKRID